MTWEEIDKKYDKEKRSIPLFERAPALETDWGRLVRSTDKLVWLFAMSGGGKSGQKKSGQRLAD
ncbi:MAG: hypothetical protein A2X28_05940 [Elusimicrobia bacterium GWA2_56_46]|jgi:hypothetical protein|nr:MAG: hypothetical protein A2X28_05940 [Elusimicrobia bacterium GWA2_56_46]OGR54362.1 MAG: hypothetical protein A2X39_06510 [Elusimicrobia bacterium GWC2_56_31]HBB65736.1 hypothetical protein [Elusimicrobiota bacterium]HBW22785.1 hypothetical protein [Elusimicrobiota bacterium]